MSLDLKKDILNAKKDGELFRAVNCKYCQPPFKHLGQYYISTGYPNDQYLCVIRKEGSIGGVRIEYCPWCGRELDSRGYA